MPCESCSVQFTVFKRKKVCFECGRYYCNNCLGRNVGICGACMVLSTRPLGRNALDHLRVRDLQCFLHRQNISTRGCVEKEDLINLVLTHVNSGDFSRRPPPQNSNSDFSSTFATLKGFTNNLNNILSSAFDIGSNNGDRSHSRNRQQNAGSNNGNRGGANRAPEHSVPYRTTSTSTGTPTSGTTPSPVPTPSTPTRPVSSPQQAQTRPHPTTSPTSNITIPSRDEATESHSNMAPSPCIITDTSTATVDIDDDSPLGQRNTTDCVEIEDVDDDWEFLGQVPDSLPPECAEIISEVSTPVPLRASARATSELNIPSRIPDDLSGESSSLKETKFCAPNPVSKRIQLNDIKNLSEVENLNIKQLKDLLILNRVDFKGCCERNELLERAKRLWRESTKSREDLEKANPEELCKICMDAPMECVMLECGHIATCIACGKRLSECPICRQYVIRVVRFFRS